MNNDYLKAMAKADEMARQYFEKGPNSVRHGKKSGSDAVEEYYDEVSDLIINPNEELEFILHLSDFISKVSLQEAKKKDSPLSAAEFLNFVRNERSLSLLAACIQDSTSKNKEAFTKRKDELVTMFQNELCKHKVKKEGCYIATAVYGSYDCPQVWILRRYRDNTLAKSLYGRVFIRTYYVISPVLVKLLGKTEWFSRVWRGALDKLVWKLRAKGYGDAPYADLDYQISYHRNRGE